MTIVTCRGRIVAGEETAALERYLDALIAIDPLILLHLGGIDFVDSAGLGLLVRYLTRAQNASGTLRICEVSPVLDRVLSVTRLKPVLQPHETEADAIADVHRSKRETRLPGRTFCASTQSQDVLAYLRELLKKAGFHPMTAANLPDALILLTATAAARRRDRRGDAGHADDAQRRGVPAAGGHASVVELPEGFERQDAGEAAAARARCDPRVLQRDVTDAAASRSRLRP